MADSPRREFENHSDTSDELMDRVWASATKLQAATDVTRRLIAESRQLLTRLRAFPASNASRADRIR